MIERIKRIYRYYFKNPPKVKVTKKDKVIRLGSVYGGWDLVPSNINKDSIIYSFGIGEDISFDLAMIEKFNCKVYGFDPTPRVSSWLKKQNVNNNFIFTPVGLATYDGSIEFYKPTNEHHISHSAFDLGNHDKIEVPCKTLKTIMHDNGHKTIDIMKMDIEGFEYEVIDSIIKFGIKPQQLLIEFHHFFSNLNNKMTEDYIDKLIAFGYDLVHISNSFCEYSFVLKEVNI